MVTQRLKALFVPEGFVLLIALAMVHWGATVPAAAPLLSLYPVAVLTGGALLAWRFRRGRLALALAGLVIADRAIVWLAPFDSGAQFADAPVVRAIAILLPIAFALLAFAGERGLLTPQGMRRLAVLAGETAVVLVVWLFASAFPAETASAFDATIVPAAWLSWLPIGQPAAIVAIIAVIALVVRAAWRPDAESRGFLWAAVACVVAVSAGPAHGRATLHFANAGLVLGVAAVESAYAMAFHDELTGLPARRALDEALARVSGTYTVAMVDVDHFKKFNDTHGHDVGDQVLRMVAARLAKVGGGGRAFRYGGEEFAVLFAGKSVAESEAHLEALRAAVEKATFTLRGPGRPKQKPKSPRARKADARQLAVTVSIGAAEAKRSAAPTVVVKAADQALYRAKEGGRNRLEL